MGDHAGRLDAVDFMSFSPVNHFSPTYFGCLIPAPRTHTHLLPLTHPFDPRIHLQRHLPPLTCTSCIILTLVYALIYYTKLLVSLELLIEIIGCPTGYVTQRYAHGRFNGYFSVTISQARGHTLGVLHVDSAHVPYRPAPYRESTRKPRGRSMRPPIRPD